MLGVTLPMHYIRAAAVKTEGSHGNGARDQPGMLTVKGRRQCPRVKAVALTVTA